MSATFPFATKNSIRSSTSLRSDGTRPSQRVGHGKNRNEAIGDLVHFYDEVFGLSFEYLQSKGVAQKLASQKGDICSPEETGGRG